MCHQKQSSPDVLQKRCFSTFRSIHRKMSVQESFLESGLKVCNFIKKRLQHRCFPVNIAKFLRTAFSQNTSSGCFWFHNRNKYKSTCVFINISKFTIIIIKKLLKKMEMAIVQVWKKHFFIYKFILLLRKVITVHKISTIIFSFVNYATINAILLFCACSYKGNWHLFIMTSYRSKPFAAAKNTQEKSQL